MSFGSNKRLICLLFEAPELFNLVEIIARQNNYCSKAKVAVM